jgi:hypothetical protein
MNTSALITMVLVISVWFILIRWVLPWFGVSTCMSGCCSVAPRPTVNQQADSGPSVEEYGSNDEVTK